MNAGLVEIDARAHSAELEVDRITEVLRAARAQAEELQAARQRAMGRITAGDPAPGADLDVLRKRYIEARHAVQDLELAAGEAQSTLARIRAERGPAERHATAGHLAEVLEARMALARNVDAQLAVLTGVLALYQAAVRDSVALGRLLDTVPAQQTMDPFLARRVIQAVRPVVPTEFRFGVSPEPPLAESDAEITRPLRVAAERELTTAASAGAGAER